MPFPEKIPRWVPPLAIGLMVAATFHTLLKNGPVWDDTALIFENPYLSSWHRAPALFTMDMWTASGQQEASDFYRPMTMVTYLINRTLGGGSPASYHVGNLLLHLAACLLLYLLARRAAGGRRWFGALFAAACFALAPIDSEPVIWLSGRFDVLVALFAVLTVLIHRDRGLRATIAVPLVFIAGMLCKESAVVIPVLLACDDLLQRRLLSRPSLIRFGAIAVLFAGYLACRRAVGVATAAAASGAGVGELFRAYWLNAANSLRLLAWPIGLDPFHPYEPPGWPAAILWAATCLLPIAALLVFVRRHPEHERAKTALLGSAWFLIALAPVTATGPNLQMTGDRYAYLPMAGLFLAASAGVGALEERMSRRALLWALYGAGALVLISFSITTSTRIGDWKDEPTLFRASLRSHPGNPYALYSLGALAAQRGDLDEAEPLLLESLRNREDAWRTHDALCFVYLRRGALGKAEGYCRRSLALNRKNPRTWVNLASVHVDSRRWAEALEETNRALALKPRYAEGEYLRGIALGNLGRIDEARAAIRRALEIDPKHAGALDVQRRLRAAPLRAGSR